MTLMEEVGECLVYWIGKWWQRRKELLYGDLMDRFWSPPLPTTANYYLSHFPKLIYLLINSIFE